MRNRYAPKMESLDTGTVDSRGRRMSPSRITAHGYRDPKKQAERRWLRERLRKGPEGFLGTGERM